MKRIPVWRRLSRITGPDPVADTRDEIRFHLETKVDDLLAQGWRPEAARVEAERQFGDPRKVQAEGERMGREREISIRRRDYWSEFAQDLRYALRTLRKDRAFTFISVLILALGIGANAAVFSVVNAVLLRPLPFPEAERLTWLRADRWLRGEARATAGLSLVTYTVDAFQEFQRYNQSFQSVTSYDPFLGDAEFTMTGRGEPYAVDAVRVAENFFQTLGVQPALGRLFVAEECRKGGRFAALLSDSFWRNRFSADPAIVGQIILLNKQPALVVGVLPPAFDFGSVFAPGQKIDVYVPAVMDIVRNWGNTLAIVGRLKPGVSIAQAQAEADVLFPRFKAAHPEWWGDYGSTLTGLKEHVSGKLRRSLITLWCAVGLILLIVCVNLSNLQMARTAARGKEFAVRAALGAGRARLCRQLLTESLALTGAGALLGLGLAAGLVFYVAHQEAIALPLLSNVRLDLAAFCWTLVIAAATALLFGLVTGIKSYAGSPQETLKSGGQGMSASRGHERLRASLVVAEIALACVLLTGAGLLLRSFLRVLDIDLGFQPARAAVVKIDFDDGRSAARRGAIMQEILRNIAAIPGIERAGIADMLPLGRNRSWGIRAKGMERPKGDSLSVVVRIVTPGYLDAMGIRLRAGRDFTWADSDTSEPVFIINEATARRYWHGVDPMSRIAQIGRREVRVVGVVADVRGHTLEAPAVPEMYIPMMQDSPEGAELVIRTSLPLKDVAPAILQTLRRLNPSQPAAEIRPLQHIVDRATSSRRFFVMLVGAFAALGLLLASFGIYGVISYSVTRQTQEIGIRMALGASAGQVRTAVVGRSLRLAATGAVLGAVGSFAAARGIASLLFGTRPEDPMVFAGVILVLCAVALAAGYIPARRASRIEPMLALRVG